jgi:AcrR family transcriptional regulator
MGAGFGLAIVPAMDSALGALPRHRAGSGSGLLRTLQQTGSAIGVAILGSVLAAAYRGRLAVDTLPSGAAHAARDSVAGNDAVCPRFSDTAPRTGLRERKKVKTRQAIRTAAYRLFAEQGYDATPVDRIAAAADVSPSTVFRYCPTKEDIVLTDEYDADMAQELRERPADEPPLVSLRAVLHASMAGILDDPQERAELVQREERVRDVPAIRAPAHENLSATGRLLGSVISERTGRAADDVEVRVFTAAVFGALHETTMYWVENGRTDDLLDLIERALGMLRRGLAL